ncbi:MAG: hypothetical protein CM15mP36_11020 [Flavobacteriales bacterium]|nr:MAG: hypothetical protein CM15mP36_11020 [Flavobacteriales bacterium]
MTAYTNTINPQTCMRIEDDMTEVTDFRYYLELFVQIPSLPVSNPPNLEYCDADADGRGI